MPPLEKPKRQPSRSFHFPKKSGEYAFVQVYVDFSHSGYRECPVLAFQFHEQTNGEILKDFLKHMHLENYPRFQYRDKILPATRGENYEIVGFGVGHFNKETITFKVRRLDLDNEDNDYGEIAVQMGVNKQHLEKIVENSKINIKY